MKKLIEKISQNQFYQKYASQIKFVLTGGFNTVLDFCIYGLLANIVKIPQVPANIISTSICIAVSFILNYKFVWKSTKSKRETAPGFLIVSLFSAWVIQNIAITGVLAIIGKGNIQNLIAKAVGSICGMVSNYLGYKVVFTK